MAHLSEKNDSSASLFFCICSRVFPALRCQTQRTQMSLCVLPVHLLITRHTVCRLFGACVFRVVLADTCWVSCLALFAECFRRMYDWRLRVRVPATSPKKSVFFCWPMLSPISLLVYSYNARLIWNRVRSFAHRQRKRRDKPCIAASCILGRCKTHMSPTHRGARTRSL